MAEVPPIDPGLWNAISRRVLNQADRTVFSRRDRIVKQAVAHIDQLIQLELKEQAEHARSNVTSGFDVTI